MKKLFFAALMALIAQTALAQTEIKINPVGLLFQDYSISAEFGVNPNFGIEPVVGFWNPNLSDNASYRAFRTRLIGKYYFNPDKGIDKFNVGGYLNFVNGRLSDGSESSNATRIALGLYMGQKWVSKGNFVFELGLGLGRNLLYTVADTDLRDVPLVNFDIFARISIGLRF
ncbi:MAG: DUF3575 domain-containing protein [Saprospiraceae bacterium]